MDVFQHNVGGSFTDFPSKLSPVFSINYLEVPASFEAFKYESKNNRKLAQTVEPATSGNKICFRGNSNSPNEEWTFPEV